MSCVIGRISHQVHQRGLPLLGQDFVNPTAVQPGFQDQVPAQQPAFARGAVQRPLQLFRG